MAAPDTVPASTQYKLAPTSRKRGADFAPVPAVIETSSPAAPDAKPPGGPPGGSPSEVRLGVTAVQQKHPPGDQHRTDDAGNPAAQREHRWPVHGEQPGPYVDDGGYATAGQHGSGPAVTGPHQ